MTQAPAPAHDLPTLDALTGGAFSAATSGERAARIRAWLSTEPERELLQEVFRELSARDRGAARALREKLDELRRAREQETIAAEWADKARTLLAIPRLNIADALAWQRDAAKVGAPLGKEPLQGLKTQLMERVRGIEDTQHRVQVQREAAVLLAQRIEVLSTKSWRDAQTAWPVLSADMAHWQAQVSTLQADANWNSVDLKYPPLLEAARTQLIAVWQAFDGALQVAVAAAADPQAALPAVPVWAAELRQARTAASEPAQVVPSRPRVDPQQQAQATAVVRELLAQLEREMAEGHGKASAGAANALRNALREQGRLIGDKLEHQAQAALAAASELEGWQRWRADQLRTELVAKAEELLKRPEGQALGGRKMQETLRGLREQWKQTDQGGVPNHALWKRFDDACNQAHKVVEAWLDKVRTEAAANRSQRLALIEEVKAWAEARGQDAPPDWKDWSRALQQFGERWRQGGHLSEKAFAELQTAWKEALRAAAAPLEAAQTQSLQRRQAMIEEATVLGAAPALRIDAVKALQQRWQAEAHAVPLDRRQEQKLWDAFRKPIDDAFQRKSAEREKVAQALSHHDRAVLDAAKALDAANASGDAQTIRQAMQGLEQALRGVPQGVPAAAPTASAEPVVPADGVVEADASAAPTPAAPRKPVIAVRGDDRPGQKKDVPSAGATGRDRPGARPGERRHEGGPERGVRGPRDAGPRREPERPRLGDAAFRAQRDALERAELALRKLAAQAHGEALTHLLEAWEKREPAQLPATQELGNRVSAGVRSAWAQALAAAAAPDDDVAATALLRLEMAAEVPTPAADLPARRALQLQLLTRRNDPAPAQTWGGDVAQLLGGAYDPARGRRLQQVLKILLRR